MASRVRFEYLSTERQKVTLGGFQTSSPGQPKRTHTHKHTPLYKLAWCIRPLKVYFESSSSQRFEYVMLFNARSDGTRSFWTFRWKLWPWNPMKNQDGTCMHSATFPLKIKRYMRLLHVQQRRSADFATLNDRRKWMVMNCVVHVWPHLARNIPAYTQNACKCLLPPPKRPTVTCPAQRLDKYNPLRRNYHTTREEEAEISIRERLLRKKWCIFAQQTLGAQILWDDR